MGSIATVHYIGHVRDIIKCYDYYNEDNGVGCYQLAVVMTTMAVEYISYKYLS